MPESPAIRLAVFDFIYIAPDRSATGAAHMGRLSPPFSLARPSHHERPTVTPGNRLHRPAVPAIQDSYGGGDTGGGWRTPRNRRDKGRPKRKTHGPARSATGTRRRHAVRAHADGGAIWETG